MSNKTKNSDMKKLIVLTGAGISAESGIKTFRDADGLWEGHDVMAVASPQGWEKDQELVLDFYNQRRRQLKSVSPNLAHIAIAKLEEKYNVTVITQNVDDLHERAGSTRIIHLHGELTKARSSHRKSTIMDWEGDIVTGDLCPDGYQLRPHIVWFGEMVPNLEMAIQACEAGEIFIIIGTSMQVYPAASLISFAPKGSSIYYIDPKPNISHELSSLPNLSVFKQKATEGVVTLVNDLMNR
jgi:NAD-dependent deacetylase